MVFLSPIEMQSCNSILCLTKMPPRSGTKRPWDFFHCALRTDTNRMRWCHICHAPSRRASTVPATWPARAVFTFHAIRERPQTPLVFSDPATGSRMTPVFPRLIPRGAAELDPWLCVRHSPLIECLFKRAKRDCVCDTIENSTWLFKIRTTWCVVGLITSHRNGSHRNRTRRKSNPGHWQSDIFKYHIMWFRVEG